MTPITAKLAGPDIAPPSVERGLASSMAAAPSVPAVLLASVAVHGLIALALIALPMSTDVARELEASWVSFDIETFPSPPAAAPEPLPPPLAPAVEPERIVHRERPLPVVAPPPEMAEQPEIHAPPSLDDAFAEPPAPAAALMAEGTGGYTIAPGELGGVPGGVPGGHGTSLVSTMRPTPQDVGPSEADRRRARRGYVHAIEELVRAHTRYPRAAGREGLEGRVELALRIGTDGHVLAVRVASTSGHGILDDAALDAAREIDRMPSPPLVAALTTTDEVRVGVMYVVR